MESSGEASFGRYVLARLFAIVWTTVAALTIVFVVFRFTPGDPFATQALQSSPEIAEQMRRQFGLDQPIYIQYLNYITNVLSGDFGVSFRHRQPVIDVVLERMLYSLILLLPALILTFAIGAAIGTYIGWNRGNISEKVSIVVLLFLRATPVYITGIIMLSLFSYQLGLFPSSGMRSPTASWDGYVDMIVSLDFLFHFMLPFLVVFLYYVSDPALIMRTGVMEKRSAEFIQLHQAKGLTPRSQMVHAARNSLLPLFTYFGIRIGLIFQGQVLIEVVFGWPGIGRELVVSIVRSDYPTAQAIIIIMAFIVIFMNFLVDTLYAYIDPTVEVNF